MEATLKQARGDAERFLARYSGAVLRVNRDYPFEDSPKRLKAFVRARRYWGKKIIAAFDES